MAMMSVYGSSLSKESQYKSVGCGSRLDLWVGSLLAVCIFRVNHVNYRNVYTMVRML